MMDMHEITRLVGLARTGNPDAKSELCRLTYNMGYFSALKVVGNPDDALDIVQEAYLRAFANLGSLQQDAAFVKWLNCIVMNLTRDFLKKKKPALFTELRDESAPEAEPDFEDDRVEFRPDDHMDLGETGRLIGAMIDTLPEDQRICVLMYYYQELGVADIAAALGIPENTVKSRLLYARKKIKAQVLELERTQGLKLYGLAPIPLLVWVLRGQGAAAVAPAAAVESMAAAAGGAVHTAASAATAAAGQAATTTTAAAATTAAKTVSVKVVAGVVAVVLAIGAGFAGYRIHKARQIARDPLGYAASLVQDYIPSSMPDFGGIAPDADSVAGEESVEPEDLDPVDHLQITFTGKSGEGRYELELDNFADALLSVRATDSSAQGKLHNGDSLTVEFLFRGRGDADEYGGYRLTTRTHTVEVDGLAQTVLSVRGLDSSALDQALEAHLHTLIADRYSDRSNHHYTFDIQQRDGFYAARTDNPASNSYIRTYHVYYENILDSTGAVSSSGHQFMYVWATGVTVEDGALAFDADGLRWNQIPTTEDGKSTEEAQEYVRVHVGFNPDTCAVELLS